MPIKIVSSFLVLGDGDLDAQTDVIMDELLEIEEQTNLIFDTAVAASLTKRTVEISFAVKCDVPADAHAIAAKLLEQVIKAAGGHPKIKMPDEHDHDVFQWEHSEQSALTTV